MTMRGSDRAFIDSLENYVPSLTGVGGLEPRMQVNLPWQEWGRWASVEAGTEAIGAGASGTSTIHTVPLNRRQWLFAFITERDAGDNNLLRLGVVQPTGYGSGNRMLRIKELSTPTTSIYWPDPGLQANTLLSIAPAEPLLLEPGATVFFQPDGSGAGATSFDWELFLMNTAIIRSRVPT